MFVLSFFALLAMLMGQGATENVPAGFNQRTPGQLEQPAQQLQRPSGPGGLHR